jgi:hypothetical protein
MRYGDKKASSLTCSMLSDNWYVIVLPPVEEEIRRVIRNERAKDAAYRSVRFWGHGRPGRGVTPSARPATSPSICGNEATARSGDEAQTALHVRRGLPATVWCRREAAGRRRSSRRSVLRRRDRGDGYVRRRSIGEFDVLVEDDDPFLVTHDIVSAQSVAELVEIVFALRALVALGGQDRGADLVGIG